MIVTVHQPNYLPYLGLFQKVARADVLVIYDTALYSKQLGFHNRNRIKTPIGAQWITVPIQHATVRSLGDVRIAGTSWSLQHRKMIDANYRKAPFYGSYASELQAVLKRPWTSLAELNEEMIGVVCRWLSIGTRRVRASTLPPSESADPTEKLIHFARSVGADTFLSGEGGHEYLDEGKFTDVRLAYDHFHPTPYPQLFGDFIPNLSAIDAIFNRGDAATAHLKTGGG